MPNNQTAIQKLAGGFSLVNTILAIALSVGGTLLTIGVTQGSFAQRLTSDEQAVKTEEQERQAGDEAINKQVVPRSEHEAHWQADEQFRRLLIDKIDSLQADVREIRAQTSRR